MERQRERDACFLALERAADSRFLIMRLCRKLPEPSSFSEALFLQKDGNGSAEGDKASKGEFNEERKEGSGPLSA